MLEIRGVKRKYYQKRVEKEKIFYKSKYFMY